MPSSKKFRNEPCTLTPGCKRKKRYLDGGCEPCHFRAEAEGTAPPKSPSPTFLARVELVNNYHKLLRKGMKQHEIAALWGMDRKALAAKLYRAKRDSGLKVINAATVRWTVQAPKLAPTLKIRPHKAGHGEGLLGVKGCKEDCCVLRRREVRRITDAAYRKGRREREAAAKAALKQEQQDKMT